MHQMFVESRSCVLTVIVVVVVFKKRKQDWFEWFTQEKTLEENELDLGYEKKSEKKIVMREYLCNQEERIKFLLIVSDVGCRYHREL